MVGALERSPIDQVYAPDLSGIAADRVAAVLRMPVGDLALLIKVHRNTLARAPNSPKVQAGLGMILRILTEATTLMGGDLGRATVWFRCQPLSGFDHQTAVELVTAGHADAVLKHLAMLRDGVGA